MSERRVSLLPADVGVVEIPEYPRGDGPEVLEGAINTALFREKVLSDLKEFLADAIPAPVREKGRRKEGVPAEVLQAELLRVAKVEGELRRECALSAHVRGEIERMRAENDQIGEWMRQAQPLYQVAKQNLEVGAGSVRTQLADALFTWDSLKAEVYVRTQKWRAGEKQLEVLRGRNHALESRIARLTAQAGNLREQVTEHEEKWRVARDALAKYRGSREFATRHHKLLTGRIEAARGELEQQRRHIDALKRIIAAQTLAREVWLKRERLRSCNLPAMASAVEELLGFSQRLAVARAAIES